MYIKKLVSLKIKCLLLFVINFYLFCIHPDRANAAPIYDVTTGSMFTIKSEEIEGLDEFTSKPRVYIIDETAKRKKLNVLNQLRDFPRTDVTCELKVKIPAGKHTLYIEFKNRAAYKVTDDFNVKELEIGSITPKSGSGGTIVKISGLFLGRKKPKVWLIYDDPSSWPRNRTKRKKCKVTMHTMNAETGISNLNCTIARAFKGNTEGELLIKNKISENSVMFNPDTDTFPVANNDFARTPGDTAITIDVLANDSVETGRTLTVNGVSTPANNGTALINDTGTITYTPITGFTGSDTFTYTVTDNELGTSSAEVTVSVGNNLVPDTSLATVIRDTLDLPSNTDLDQDELVKLTELDATGLNIENLEGMQYCTNLTILYLSSNGIIDITSLSNLTNLQQLYLRNNDISDISSLAGLTNLTDLDVSYNQITSMVGLPSNWPKTVDLSNNFISSTQGLPVNNPTNLVALNLASNSLTDISDLSGLSQATNLRDLNLNDNGITDITPLAQCTSLVELHLNSNELNDITGLSGLSNLETLDLSSNTIDNLKPICDNTAGTALTKLVTLKLSSNTLEDENISTLSATLLTALRYLYLDDNSLIEITALSSFTTLTYLDLQDNLLSNNAKNSIIVNLESYGVKVIQ